MHLITSINAFNALTNAIEATKNQAFSHCTTYNNLFLSLFHASDVDQSLNHLI
jgi:hypothetical protein